MKNKNFFFSLIFIFGIIIRVLSFSTQPLSLDELITLDVFRFRSWEKVSIYLENRETQMPLYYYIGYLFQKMGLKSYLWYAVLSLLLYGSGAFFLVSFAVKKYRANISIYLAVLLSFSFMGVVISKGVRPYTLLFLLSSILTIYSIKKERTKLDFAIIFTCTLLSCLTHYFGILFALVCLLLIFIQNIKFIQKYSYFFCFLLGSLFMGVTTFSGKILKDFATVHDFRVALSMDKFIHVSFLLIPGGLLLLSGLFLRRKKKPTVLSTEYKKPIVALITLSFFPFVIMTFKSLLGASVFEARYLIVSLPALYLMASFGWDNLFREKSSSIALLILVSLLLMETLVFRGLLGQSFREDSLGASNQVRQWQNNEKKAKSIIVSCDACLRDYLNESFFICPQHLKNSLRSIKEKRVAVLTPFKESKCLNYFKENYELKKEKSFKGFHTFYFSK